MKKQAKYLILMLTVLMTILMLGCASSPEEGTGEYVDDAWITSKVKSALVADPQVSGLDIQVETYRGVVQLSGFVDTEEQSREAEDVARSIEGVRDVENSLTVK